MIFKFGDFQLDTGLLELRRNDARVPIEPQVFDLLRLLIENRNRVVSKDEIVEVIWGGRIVSEATMSSRMNALRRAVGDDGKRQEIVLTSRGRGFRFVQAVDVEEASGLTGNPEDRFQDNGGTRGNVALELQQQVRFCKASDGVQIAYATVGQGTPLVKAANWLCHLEYDWESPLWRGILNELAAEHFLVRYDERGTSLSDWDVQDISFDAFVTDLEAVVDAVGLERFALWGHSHGCPVALAYAARHPERVSHLILYGGFIRGRSRRGDTDLAEQQEAIRTLIKQGWAQDNPAFRQIFTAQILPDGTAEEFTWFNDLQRVSTSPDNAVRIRDAINQIDVSNLLRSVAQPTLVIHRRGDAMTPFEDSRQMATEIPDARFVALEGRNHHILDREPEWPRYVATIKSFLSE